MTETKTNIDKINSFLAHLDSQCEKINAGNFGSFIDSSSQPPNSPQNSISQVNNDIPIPQIGGNSQQVQKSKNDDSQLQQPQTQNQSQLSNPIQKQQTKKQSKILNSPQISPEDEIKYNLNDDITKKNRSWCERSLEQLEMTIQLLDQCFDNDLKDLSRQQNVINLCKKQIDEIKKICPI